jgi:hypothetical protein
VAWTFPSSIGDRSWALACIPRQRPGPARIVQHPNRGAEVAELTTDNLQEIFLIRESLESTALRHSVPKMTDGDLAKAEEVLDRIDGSGSHSHR